MSALRLPITASGLVLEWLAPRSNAGVELGIAPRKAAEVHGVQPVGKVVTGVGRQTDGHGEAVD